MFKRKNFLFIIAIYLLFLNFMWGEIEINPQSIQFGIVGISQTKESHFKIKNSGSSPIVISKISMKTGQFFQVYFSHNYTLTANQEVIVKLSYTPRTEGWNSDEVIIEYVENNQVAYKTIFVEGAGAKSYFSQWSAPFTLFTGTDVSAYMLLSFPGKVTDPGKILEEAFGGYDPSRWRAFIYDSQWKELSQSFTGKGYEAFFLINNQSGKRLSLQNILTVKDSIYKIPIKKGWNLIRNPYSFPVSDAHVGLKSGGTPVFYGFQGTWKIESVLYPWFGYAIYAESPDTLQIFGYRQIKSGNLFNRTHIKFKNKIIVAVDGYIDSLNYFGTGIKEIKLKKPLFLDAPLKTYFENSENELFGAIIQPDKKEWIFTVQTEPGKNVELWFPALDEQFMWNLIDEDGNIVRINERSHFIYTQQKPVQSFIIRKINSTHKIPLANKSDQIHIFPNPANPSVYINFSLEKNAKVVIDICNLMGQVIKKLHDSNLTKGSYTLIWDGNDHFGNPSPSGMYFIRINTGDRFSIRKVLLVR